MMFCGIFIFLCIQIVSVCSQNLTEEEIQFIDNTVEALIACKTIPGIGISLIRNGSVFYKGYGHAKLDPPTRFDEFTVSNIGSTGKAFTAALLGILITESRRKGESLGWESKVRDILGPDFQMSTDCVTSEMTIKDLLIHRTGAQSTDFSLITVSPNITRGAYVSRLKYLPQMQKFRDEMSYNNFMYMMAGHVAEVIGGKPFETLIKEKIWDPLGMNASIFLDDESSRDKHFAFPYFLVNETLSFKEDDFLLYRLRDLSPAGGLCSSPHDLLRWLSFLLGNGTSENGLTLIEKEMFEEMFKPHISIPQTRMDRYSLINPYPVISISSWYGYAWFGRNYRGHSSLFHTGSLHAYSTIASLYPQANSGFFMIANGPWPIKFKTDLEPLSYILSDILLQEEPWLNSSTVCTFPEPWEEKQKTKNETEDNVSTDDYDVTPCLGHYGHRVYGDVRIGDNSSSKELLFKVNSIGQGNLTLLFSENSTFRMNFAGRLSLIFGQDCEARFDDQSDGLFNKLKLKCFGEYEFVRGISFLSESHSTSSSIIKTAKSLLILVVICVVYFTKQD